MLIWKLIPGPGVFADVLLCMQEVANDASGCFPVYECQWRGELCTFIRGIGDIRASGYCAVIDTADE